LRNAFRLPVAVVLALVCVGCIEPQDRRPGLWLRGDVVAEAPSDWIFTDEWKEIAVQVRTPYLLPHSVTIWCAVSDGRLYVGAREPETKRWPGWADRQPDVRLGIGGKVYEVRLAPVDDPDEVARVQRAYAGKYDLGSPPPQGAPPVRYWLVEGRG
jgi:hypothetical protein